jgi:hypothetical protein
MSTKGTFEKLRVSLAAICVLLVLGTQGVRAERVLLFKQRIEANFDVAEVSMVWLNQDGSLSSYQLEIREESGQSFGLGFLPIPEGTGPTMATVLAIGRQGELWAAPVSSSFTVFQGTVGDAQAALNKAKGAQALAPTPIPKSSPVEGGSTALASECDDLLRSNAEITMDVESLEQALSAMEQESKEASLSSREKSLDLALRELVDALRRERQQAAQSTGQLAVTGPDFEHIPMTELENKLEEVRSQREALEQEMAGWGIF